MEVKRESSSCMALSRQDIRLRLATCHTAELSYTAFGSTHVGHFTHTGICHTAIIITVFAVVSEVTR